MVCEDDRFHCATADGPTIIDQGDEAVSEKVPSFLIVIASILAPTVKEGDRRIPSQLSDLQTETTLQMNNLELYIKSITSYEDVTSRSTTGFMRDNGFHGVPVTGVNAKKEGCGKVYMTDVTKVL